MVSVKERQRLSRMFDQMQEKLERQRASITRLVAENVAMSAALAEVAAVPVVDNEEQPELIGKPQAIATDCLAAVNRNRGAQQESSEAQESPKEEHNAEE
jgi:hypothetical protein